MATRLIDLQILVIDCQTTGSNAEKHHLTEIGWLPIQAAGVDAVSLDSPETFLVRQPECQPLTRHIKKLTGITDMQMDGAVDVGTIWNTLSAAAIAVMQKNQMPYCPAVIHFARFEMAFIQKLQRRAHVRCALPLKAICTHQIASRLLPGLPRKGLRAVAGYLGHSVPMLKRCKSHIQATAVIWKFFTERLMTERGVCTIDALDRWLEGAHGRKSGPRVFPLSRDIRLAAPDEPGIYRFSRSNGDHLYIGKATSLKQRVNSYFQKGRRHSENTLEMLSQAAQLDCSTTDTALEAAMLESDEIKRCQTPYNQALTTGCRAMLFVSRDMGRCGGRRDDQCRLGPVPSRTPFKSMHDTGRWLTAPDPASKLDTLTILPMADGYGPADDIASLGVSLFVQKHSELLECCTIWQGLLRIGTHAWREKMARKESAGLQTENGDSGQKDTDPPGNFVWTPEAVVSSMEATMRYCGFLLRRARWLTILSEATISWQHRLCPESRMHTIVLHHGRMLRNTLETDGSALPLPPGYKTPWSRRQERLDVATYDRLRVLTTEIRRIIGDKRQVYVRLNRRVILRNNQLKRMLWWI